MQKHRRQEVEKGEGEMPEWKRRASAVFPDLREELDADDTIYTVFFELLPRCVDAHKNGDIRFELAHIYEYAAWCFRQEETDLWNAAGVAFYEHLVDQPETLAAIPQWLEPDIFEALTSLFAARMSEANYLQLQQQYKMSHPLPM